MTDKQIIIDGVDIGKCTFSIVYLGNIICGTMSDRNPKPNCSKYPNCYFKQLVRKTQLSIEQSKELIRLRQELKESTVKNKNLRQECEELKKKLNTSEEWRIKAENLNEKQDLENTRYRKALEKIEKVCIEDTREFADGTEVRYDSLDKILDIINKAKGEGNE